MPGDSGRAPARAIERAFTREHSLACETVFTSQRLSSGSLSPPCQPVPLGSISPNPRCWYRETRWSASNQRQDPSSSSASSYSRGRLKFEGEAEVRRGYSLSLPLSFSLTQSLILFLFLSPSLFHRLAVLHAPLAAIFLGLPPSEIQQL